VAQPLKVEEKNPTAGLSTASDRPVSIHQSIEETEMTTEGNTSDHVVKQELQ